MSELQCDSERRYMQASEELNALHEQFRRLRNINVGSIGAAVLGGVAIGVGALTGHNVLNETTECVGIAMLVGGIGGFALTGVDIVSMVPEEARLIAEKKQYRPQPTE